MIVLAFSMEAQDYSLIQPDFSLLSSKDHPRLFLSDEDFDDIRTMVDSTPARKMHDIIMARADSMVRTPVPIEFRFDESGRRMIGQARMALDRLLHCSYAYRFSRDTKYLEQAETDLQTVCSFPTWNAYNHFLDAAEMALAVGIAYDWLYSSLSETIRQSAYDALRRQAFEPASDEDAAWFYYADGNWNQICNAGLATAAIASYQPCDSTAQRILIDAIWSNGRTMKSIYSPSGCYAEGPGYWNYGNTFQAVLISALESAFGEDFGLSNTEGFLQTIDYIRLIHRPFGNIFNYSDNRDENKPSCALWYFADRAKEPGIICNELTLLDEGRYRDSSELRLLPLLMRYALRVGRSSVETNRNGWDVYLNKGNSENYEDLPLMMIRGYAEDCYLGIKGGSPTTNHAHMDGGSFVYDAFGSVWATDPETEPYAVLEEECAKLGGDFWDMSQGSARWRMQGIGNSSHSTISINDKDFNVKGKARIIEIIDSINEKGAVLDLSSLYPGEVSKLERRISIKSDGTLTVMDSITAADTKDAQVKWTFVTPAQITVCRKSIRLRNEGSMVTLRTKSRKRVKYVQFPSESDSYGICGFVARIPKGHEVLFETTINKE